VLRTNGSPARTEETDELQRRMKLRWGFKTEANRIARDLRRELGLDATAPLDPWRLAAHLDIPVVNLSSLKAEASSAVMQFTRKDREAFSAVTVFCGYKRLIVVNDVHSRGRQASNIAHELAHSLLWHDPAPAFDGDGTRELNAQQEEEAQWLSGALLISEEAALSIVRRRSSLEDAAECYGTSADMVRGRINVTGARKRAELARRYSRPR
jgi:Zn-dependent peptidase ImmA (M78 family)